MAPAKKSSSRTAKPDHQHYDILSLPDVILPTATRAKSTPIYLVESAQFSKWIAPQSKETINQLAAQSFTAKAGSVALTYGDDGKLAAVIIGYSNAIGLYTICPCVDKIGNSKFHIESDSLTTEHATHLVTGWILACYRFTAFKTAATDFPQLIQPKGADTTRAESLARAIYMVRNLINLPPNALGPQALADAAVMVAKIFKAKSRVIVDTDLITENFPLIYGVGDGSERRPRLVDITWGHAKHPKVTLVGKGVCFDTGGYDLKPSSAMLLMKKDMGGAAMALGVAYMIMALKLPVRLRVLIPAVENSVSGRAYRPGDILHSRKGLTVEINNTDAEGRLVLADCLTLASEESPDLLIDFSTLTGAGRVATGYEIAPIYSNNDDLAHTLQTLSMEVNDPLWHMPLWENYRSDILSPNADLSNSGNNPAGSITAALFLQSFVGNGIDWIHLDHYAWEMTGKPGRPKGGADTGLRAVLALIERTYNPEKSKTSPH